MYLIGKILLSLVIAFVLGFGTAWLAWFAGTRQREDDVTALWQRRFGDLQRERDQAVTVLTRELDEARQQVPTLEKSLSERSDLIAKLEADLAEWRERLPELQSTAAERAAQIDTLHDELAARDQQIATLQAKAGQSAAAARSDAQWDALRAQLKRAEVELEAANGRANEFETAARELAEELNEALVAEKQAAREAAEASASEIDALQAEIARLNARETNGTSTMRTLRPGVAPQGLIDALPADQSADDLKKIRGIGPVLEGTLNQLGIYYFEQIASLSSDEIDWVTYHLDTFPGRIERDDWVQQAAQLAGRPDSAGPPDAHV